jgi:hypothetical protein
MTSQTRRAMAGTPIAWLILALSLNALLSCAGRPRVSQFAKSDAQKDEIRELWAQVRIWRAEIGLRGVDPPDRLLRRYFDTPMHKLNICEPPAEPAAACNDVCGLAENICENAEAICRISKELHQDSWAANKCASAKVSCKEARARCCKCEETNSPG